MSLRRCRGCPKLVQRGAPLGRCEACRAKVEAARGSRQERGYDGEHDRLRREYQRRMDAGESFVCWRHGDHLVDPSSWHLGHDDIDRSRYRGPECPGGNLSAGGRSAHGDFGVR